MLPEEEKEMIMDSLEVIQNKGYVSIADADYNRGFSAGEEKGFSAGEEKGFSAGFSEGKAEGFLDGKAEGFSEGEIKGITDAKLEMAKAMLMEGIPIDKIRIISGLSEEEILKL